LAAESLGELAHLPERIAESLDRLKLGGGGSSSADDGDVCGELGLGPGAAAGLAALCVPVLNPAAAAGDSVAGAAAASSTAGPR
jgi:hypothetical protein